MNQNSPNLDALSKQLADLSNQELEIKKKKAEIKSTLLSYIDEDLSQEEGRRASPWGTYNFGRIKVTRKKKVIWDQRLLRGLIEQIATDGANPGEYIDVVETYHVPETRWKDWSAELKNAFRPARTESSAGVDVEITEEK